MKIKLEQFKPEEITYVVIYRNGRNQKKVKINPRFFTCINKVFVLKTISIGKRVYFTNYLIRKWWSPNDCI